MSEYQPKPPTSEDINFTNGPESMDGSVSLDVAASVGALALSPVIDLNSAGKQKRGVFSRIRNRFKNSNSPDTKPGEHREPLEVSIGETDNENSTEDARREEVRYSPRWRDYTEKDKLPTQPMPKMSEIDIAGRDLEIHTQAGEDITEADYISNLKKDLVDNPEFFDKIQWLGEKELVHAISEQAKWLAGKVINGDDVLVLDEPWNRKGHKSGSMITYLVVEAAKEALEEEGLSGDDSITVTSFEEEDRATLESKKFDKAVVFDDWIATGHDMGQRARGAQGILNKLGMDINDLSINLLTAQSELHESGFHNSQFLDDGVGVDVISPYVVEDTGGVWKTAFSGIHSDVDYGFTSSEEMRNIKKPGMGGVTSPYEISSSDTLGNEVVYSRLRQKVREGMSGNNSTGETDGVITEAQSKGEFSPDYDGLFNELDAHVDQFANAENRMALLKNASDEELLALIGTMHDYLTPPELHDTLPDSALVGKMIKTNIDAHNEFSVSQIFLEPHQREEYLEYMRGKLTSVESVEDAADVVAFGVVSLHMYGDGNGRTARLLHELILNGYDGGQEDIDRLTKASTPRDSFSGGFKPASFNVGHELKDAIFSEIFDTRYHQVARGRMIEAMGIKDKDGVMHISENKIRFNLLNLEDGKLKDELVYTLQQSDFGLESVDQIFRNTEPQSGLNTIDTMMRFSKIDEKLAKDIINNDRIARMAYMKRVLDVAAGEYIEKVEKDGLVGKEELINSSTFKTR